MNRLIEFIRSIHVLLLFLLLEGGALFCYARSTNYTQARLLAGSERIVGRARGAAQGVGHYFRLNGENRRLTERIAVLEQRLARYRTLEHDSLERVYAQGTQEGGMRMLAARVRSNSINRSRNFIVLDKGAADGVVANMALLSADGAMAGYVVEVAPRFSVAVSVLNTDFRASGKLSGEEYFGAIRWDGTDRYHVRLTELSKYADLAVGDEIVTTGFSQFFPEDVLVGWVEQFDLNASHTAYEAEVRLAADLSSLRDVILVANPDASEIFELENDAENLYR